MERLLQWGLDLPWILTEMARQIVLAVPECHRLLKALRNWEYLDRLPPIPPVQAWLPMYRRHACVMNVVGQFVIPAGLWKRMGGEEEEMTPHRQWRQLQAECRRFGKMTVDELRSELTAVGPDELQAAIASAACWAILGFVGDANQIESDLDGRVVMPWRMQRLWKTPEMAFFFRVWFPCLLLYGESHVRLYARARRGSMSALEKLLKLDKSLIHDPRIAELYHQAAHTNRERHKFITAALNAPIDKMPLERLKKNHAALISKMFGMAQIKLNAPEIRELFDAKAEVYSQGERTTDEDFPASLEALGKDIQRRRAFWKVCPDKNCA